MKVRMKSLLAGAAVLVLLAVKLIAHFYPGCRLWGLNQLAYFSLPLAIISMALIIILIFLIAYGSRHKVKSRVVEKVKTFMNVFPRILFLSVCVVVILVLFYIFSDSTNLLGDGTLRIQELDNLQQVPTTEPLDFLVHDLTYDYILKPLGFSALGCYRLWSYIAGLLYVLAVWLIASKLKREGIDKWLTLAYLVGWAGVMVFFGYVENYALASVILLFFFNYSIEYIHSGKKLTLVVGLFLLAFFMHNLIIFLLPSLMYILITRFKKNRNGSIWGMFVSIIPVFIWIVISYAEKEGSAFLLPNSSSEPGYLLWSGSHLLDILNELLLVSPVFIVLLFIQRIKYKKKKLHLRVFFWLSALASLVVLLFLDPKLGMARDWDLFAMPLLGFHMALFISADWQKAGKLVKSAVVVVSIAFSVIWVLLNSDEEHSIERYKNIINLESERRCYGYEVLGEYYRKQDNLVEAEQAYSLAIQSKPHYRCYLWLGYIQRQLDKDEQAEQNFMKVLELMPNQPNALDNLGRLYFKMGRWKEAWYYLNQYIQTPTGNIDRGAKVALKMLENKLAKDKERVDD